jgi:CBS domain-containing protein
MPELKVKDLMLASSQCAIVSESAPLPEALRTMEATRMMFQRWDYKPRIVLVHNEDHQIVGTVRHFDVIRSLEPKYRQFGDLRRLSLAGLPREFVEVIFAKLELWNHPLRELCREASDRLVRDVMTVITENEFIDGNSPIAEAIHRMLMGNHPSLFVNGDGGVIGILRMSDIADHVCREIKGNPDTGGSSRG